MASPKKTTLEAAIPVIDEAIDYLKKCNDFTTEEVYSKLYLIDSYCSFRNNQCDNPDALAKHIDDAGFGHLFLELWGKMSGYLDAGIRYHGYSSPQAGTGFVNFNMMLSSFSAWSSDSPQLSATLGKCGAISLLLKGLEKIIPHHGKGNADIAKTELHILGILQNAIHKCPSNRDTYRKSNAVSILEKYLKFDTSLQMNSLCILAFIVNDSESALLASSGTSVEVLLTLLKEGVNSDNHTGILHSDILTDHGAYGYPTCYTLDVINHLAINDANKEIIVANGTIPAIIRMLEYDFPEKEQKLAAEALWNLAFIESVRKSDEMQRAVPRLKILMETQNRDLRGACASALWQLMGGVNVETGSPYKRNTSRSPLPSYEDAISEPFPSAGRQSVPQIMVSYQWNSQSRVVEIRDKLVASGYKVWMDVTNMRGDILTAMADAVQNSDVILICMTERYKDSKNCRSEASYAYKLHKKVIPLLLEKDYTPDGWLGLLQGMDLYYSFYSDDQLKKNMGQLLNAIGESVATGKHTTAGQHQAPGVLAASPRKQLSPDCSEDDVQAWLKDSNLTELCEAFKELDGRHLKRMHGKCCKDEDKFEDLLKSEYKLNDKSSTKFIVALQDAF
ncbi:uncharacterized protein [Amphiura filiformis]|uniref:uncharacterized protein n=1 Tax=Amphiura filiformis TaxID=82378 RepID=UPI003B2147D2